MVLSLFGFFFGKKKAKSESKEKRPSQLVRVKPRSRPSGAESATEVEARSAEAKSAAAAGATHPSESLSAPVDRSAIASDRGTRSSHVAPHHRSSASVSAPAQPQQRPSRKGEPQLILVGPARAAPAIVLATESPAEDEVSAAPVDELKVEEAEDDLLEAEPPKKKKTPPAPRKFTFSDWDITRATGHEYHRGIGFVS